MASACVLPVELVDKAMSIIEGLRTKDIILNDAGIYDKKAQMEWRKSIQYGKEPIEPSFTREQVEACQSIAKAIKLIPLLVLKTTRKGLVGSYHLKHVIERLITTTNQGSYMSNGEAILAMLLLDHTMILSKEGSWNCTFHCSWAKNDHCESSSPPDWRKI